MSMTFKGNCIQGFKESYNNLISNPFQMTHPQQHRQSSLLSQLLSYAASSKSGDNEDCESSVSQETDSSECECDSESLVSEECVLNGENAIEASCLSSDSQAIISSAPINIPCSQETSCQLQRAAYNRICMARQMEEYMLRKQAYIYSQYCAQQQYLIQSQNAYLAT